MADGELHEPVTNRDALGVLLRAVVRQAPGEPAKEVIDAKQFSTSTSIVSTEVTPHVVRSWCFDIGEI